MMNNLPSGILYSLTGAAAVASLTSCATGKQKEEQKPLNIVYIMTDGGPYHSTEVSLTYIMKTAFTDYNFGKANAMSVILFLMVLVFGFIQLKFMSHEDVYN